MTGLAEAWQRALGAEQQAVFGYALAGPHLDTATGSRLAHACQSAHETLRDSVVATVATAGGAPAPPPADYPALYPVRDARSAQLLAVRLENACASAWRYLYATAADSAAAAATHSSAARAAAQAALTASAVRATQWRLLLNPAAATVAFPGI